MVVGGGGWFVLLRRRVSVLGGVGGWCGCGSVLMRRCACLGLQGGLLWFNSSSLAMFSSVLSVRWFAADAAAGSWLRVRRSVRWWLVVWCVFLLVVPSVVLLLLLGLVVRYVVLLLVGSMLLLLLVVVLS